MNIFTKLFRKEKPRGYWLIKRSMNKQWYFVLKAGNGQTLFRGEMYHNRGDVFRAIDSIKLNVQGKIKE